MLNKLLCYMWGHEFTTFYRLKRHPIYVAAYEGSFIACKHCGEEKK